MRRRWLVTGASGALGGHLVEYLCESEAVEGGAEIITSSRTLLDRPHHFQDDLTAPGKVRELLLAAQPTHIIHLAGITSLSEAAARPGAAWEANVVLARRLAQHAAET